MSKMEYMPVDCLQVPKMLFQMDKFKNLSNTAKILYSLFLDRLKFAVQNGWVDGEGDLFVIYPKSEMKKDLNTTRYGVDQAVQELVEIVNKLRREIPDIVLRTTLISGFPGETQEDHEELMSFVDEMEFDRLGVFTYSPEEDTPAATMPDQVAEEVKEARRDEIMELQQEISYDKGTDRIGQELLVMIEGKVADESAYIGRTYGDAPKVDGYIFVQTGELLMTGDFAKVRVTGALEYDLIGELADEYTE